MPRRRPTQHGGMRRHFIARFGDAQDKRDTCAFFWFVFPDGLVKNSLFLSFRPKPVSSYFNKFWMPDRVRHDGFKIFYESIKKWYQKKPPCPALSCASPLRPERAETQPPVGGLRQSARFLPAASSMLGAGQRGKPVGRIAFPPAGITGGILLWKGE